MVFNLIYNSIRIIVLISLSTYPHGYIIYTYFFLVTMDK